MTKVSDWIYTECGTGAFRIVVGGDPGCIADRVAFVGKTPRVRIRNDYQGVLRGTYDDGTEYTKRQWPEFLNWCEGYKGDDCNDPESRKWCDNMLKALGYEL